MALDAISTPTIVDEVPFKGRVLWAINGREADASTAIDIKAAPGTGKSLYILSIMLTSNDADAYPQLQDGDGTVLVGPFYPILTTGGWALVKEFKRPVKLTSNKALSLKAAAGGNISIWVEGATAED